MSLRGFNSNRVGIPQSRLWLFPGSQEGSVYICGVDMQSPGVGLRVRPGARGKWEPSRASSACTLKGRHRLGNFVQGPGLLPGPSVALHLTKVLSMGFRDLNRWVPARSWPAWQAQVPGTSRGLQCTHLLRLQRSSKQGVCWG